MNILRDISDLWMMFHVVIIFLLFFTSKYPFRYTVVVISSISAALLAVYVTFMVILGGRYIVKLAVFCCVIPSLVLFYLFSQYRDGRFFFTFCLSDTSFYWIAQTTSLLDRLCGETYVVLLLSRLILFPLFELFVWHKLRRPYMELQAGLSESWWMTTVIAAGFYCTLITVYIPVGAEMPGLTEVILLLLVLFLMPVTYFTILGSLHRQMFYYEAQNRQDILSAQVTGLQDRIAAVRSAEETIRIERHDLRHKLLTIAAMAEQGKTDEILDYIYRLEGALEHTKQEVWCSNSLLNAVFSVYFAQARQQKIQVRAHLAIPDELAVDVSELSTVFANALENAIYACCQLPVEKREIICTCICCPSLMLEVSNPYMGTVLFDQGGRPVASKGGHGIGTRSIAAFCERYGAYCAFEAADGWFHLKIAL